MGGACSSVVGLDDALLHDLPQVGVLHGGRHALLIVDLLVDWRQRRDEERNV